MAAATYKLVVWSYVLVLPTNTYSLPNPNIPSLS